jgi:hypothetical protein
MATSWRKGASGRGGWLPICCICIHPRLRARAVTDPTRRRTPDAPIHSRSRMTLPDSLLRVAIASGRETGSSLFPHSAAGGNGKRGPDWPQIGKSGGIARPRECPAERRATILGGQPEWTLLRLGVSLGVAGCLSAGHWQLAMSDKNLRRPPCRAARLNREDCPQACAKHRFC